MSKYRESKALKYYVKLTFVKIFGCYSEHGVLDVFVFVHFSFVMSFIEVRRVVVFISNADTNEFSHCNEKKFRC